MYCRVLLYVNVFDCNSKWISGIYVITLHRDGDCWAMRLRGKSGVAAGAESTHGTVPTATVRISVYITAFLVSVISPL